MAYFVAKYNYWIYVLLMMIGLYAMIAKNNLAKKIIGMNIFQTAIIVFYVSIGAKRGATIPIIEHGPGHGAEGAAASAEGAAHAAAGAIGHVAQSAHNAAHAIDPAHYINPLPHVLMLTAIVVSVSTLGVALAIMMGIYKRYGTLEEDEILEQIRK